MSENHLQLLKKKINSINSSFLKMDVVIEEKLLIKSLFFISFDT